MQYRRLGSTDLQVSVIGLGTWQFGGEWGRDYTPAEAGAIINTAGELGINLIDTAECYGDHLSERLIGQAIKSQRENWLVATKFGHHYHGFLERTRDFDAASVRSQLEASLQALQTDYVDLYQWHSPTAEEFDSDELWQTLHELKRAGKVRHLGISISGDGPQQTAAARANGAASIQVIYNRLQRQPEADILPTCRRDDLGVLARVPLASGLLSGKYTAAASFPENDVRHGRDIAATIAEVDEIRRSEVPAGTDMAAWSLAWCLRHEAVTSVIPGCKSPQQVRANAAAAEMI